MSRFPDGVCLTKETRYDACYPRTEVDSQCKCLASFKPNTIQSIVRSNLSIRWRPVKSSARIAIVCSMGGGISLAVKQNTIELQRDRYIEGLDKENQHCSISICILHCFKQWKFYSAEVEAMLARFTNHHTRSSFHIRSPLVHCQRRIKSGRFSYGDRMQVSLAPHSPLLSQYGDVALG